MHAGVTQARWGLRSKGRQPCIGPAGNSTPGNPSPSPVPVGRTGAAACEPKPSPRDFPHRSRAAELGAGDRGIPLSTPKGQLLLLTPQQPPPQLKLKFPSFSHSGGCKKATAWPTEPAHGPRGYFALVQTLPRLAKLVQRHHYLTLTHAANYPTKNGQKRAKFAKCSPLEGLQEEHLPAAER